MIHVFYFIHITILSLYYMLLAMIVLQARNPLFVYQHYCEGIAISETRKFGTSHIFYGASYNNPKVTNKCVFRTLLRKLCRKQKPEVWEKVPFLLEHRTKVQKVRISLSSNSIFPISLFFYLILFTILSFYYIKMLSEISLFSVTISLLLLWLIVTLNALLDVCKM